MGDKAAGLGLVLVHCGELGVSGWEIASGKQQSQRMWSRSVEVGTAAHSCTWTWAGAPGDRLPSRVGREMWWKGKGRCCVGLVKLGVRHRGVYICLVDLECDRRTTQIWFMSTSLGVCLLGRNTFASWLF